ncbi:tachykinin-3 [Protobothrops mucrosquamatus]|uniref:tachykinin-3 n=1 Tax=Protobothrops mucrosquamatus TaxID=103944 RepID=UPI0010FB1ACF|nr:tachykinin-3 [Protobothrops mucrosquamatus]
MKSSLVLTVLLSLLVAKLRRGYCIESLEQQMPSGVQTKVRQTEIWKQTNPNLYKLPLSLLRRLYGGQGISYEALLRLSGKEEINPQTLASSQKRDMHDFFVGLMGKRTIEPGVLLIRNGYLCRPPQDYCNHYGNLIFLHLFSITFYAVL